MNRNLATVSALAHGKEKQGSKPLLATLVKWTTLAIFMLNLILLVMYIIGSYQKVSDESQLALVKVHLAVSILLIVSAFYGIIFSIYYAIHNKKTSYLIGALGYIAIALFGFTTALVSSFIIGAAGGS